jgi:hypothetical protein
VNPKTITNLDRFKCAKEIIIKNIDTIKMNVHFQPYDSIRRIEHLTIFNANRYYFENNVAKQNVELRSVLKLWDDKLIPDNTQGFITLTTDTNLLFDTYIDIGTFSAIRHFIVYNPKDNNGGLGLSNSKIIKRQELGNHWYYIIEERTYVD